MLRLFGHPTLDSLESNESGSILQPRRIALLALLALHGEQGTSRDKLLGLLWPESDGEGARHALSNAVYAIRRALGRHSILSDGRDGLRLNPDITPVDVHAFRAAMDRGDREVAVSLYAGSFMDGFFLSGAPEFERWVDLERDRLAREYSQALEELAEASEARADAQAAAEWWLRLAEHEPYSTRYALRAVMALAAAGEPARALRHGVAHTELLQGDLGLEPDSQLNDFLNRLRVEDGPARSGSPVPALPRSTPLPATLYGGVVGSPGPGVGPGSHASPNPGHGPGHRFAAPAALLFVLLAVTLLYGLARPHPPGTIAQPEIRSLAVLPLENCTPDPRNPARPDPSQEYFADGLTDALITELAQIPALRVTSRTSAMRFKGECGARGRRTPSLAEIADQLGVEAVLEGTLVREQERLRANVQLILTATDEHLWATGLEYDRGIEDVVRLQREIAQAVSLAIRSRTGSPGAGSPAIPPSQVDPAAYAHYLRGRYLWNERRLERYAEALDHFGQALSIDSTFAPAYAGLADVYVHLDEWGGRPEKGARAEGFRAARRALALDAGLAEAHAALAHLLMHTEEWDEAEREYRKAIALDPSYSEALILYAFQLSAWERHAEAIEMGERALAADPISPDANSFLGYIYYYARRYDEAIHSWERLLQLYPGQPGSHFLIGYAHALLGTPEEAVEWGRKGMALADSAAWAQVAWAKLLGLAGERAQARRVLSAVLEPTLALDLDPLTVAHAYAVAATRDSAFQWLETAGAGDHGWLMFLRVEPAYDSIRADPRFEDWIRRMRLKQAPT